MSHMGPFNPKVINDGDMSGDLNSTVLRMKYHFLGSITVNWSGTSPVGSLKLQASNSQKNIVDDIESDSWIDLDGDEWDSTQALSGNTGSHRWNFVDFGSKYMRVVYTRSSGVGTLQCIANIKEA